MLVDRIKIIKSSRNKNEMDRIIDQVKEEEMHQFTVNIKHRSLFMKHRTVRNNVSFSTYDYGY